MSDVDVIILHPLPGPGAGPLERALADARSALAERHVLGFLAAGADTARIVEGEPDERPFGARLREVVAAAEPGHGLVLLGSGGLVLATVGDRRMLVDAASASGRRALTNNRYSADVVALTASAVEAARAVPPELPADNALPRWLQEIAGVDIADLRRRWRLEIDLDSPLDLLLATGAPGFPHQLSAAAKSLPRAGLARERLGMLGVVLNDPRAEVVVAGRTSSRSLGWLERNARCRIRAIVEERGLRGSSRLAQADGPARPRPPRSILGMLLDRDGPGSLGERLAELGDAAVVDTRVLLAHRLGADEDGWPLPEDRFASDLLLAGSVADPWLAGLTAAAAGAPIPVALGGHTLVGPGLRLICASTGRPARARKPSEARR